MEVAVPSRILSCGALRLSANGSSQRRTLSSTPSFPLCPSSPLSSSGFPARASLSTAFVAPFGGGSVSGEHCGLSLRTPSLNPSLHRSSGKRSVVTMVLPYLRGFAREQPPPDLPSYFFHYRIVYLGLPLYSTVTQLIVAELIYLQNHDAEKPIYFYINSTGTVKGGEKMGYEVETLAIYDLVSFTKSPIFTLCVGNAWGEAALLLACGTKGNRAALPSSTIMIRQPIDRFRGQATDVNLAAKEVKHLKAVLVELYARHTGKTTEQIETDIRRPKYFSPSEAVEYGIIDKVLYNERSKEDKSVGSALKNA